MPNYYEITPTDDRLTLTGGKGEASFGVRYVGGRSVEARARAVPLEGTLPTWLRLESPDQRAMQPGQTQTFRVHVTIPPGTLPGRYGMRLDLMSVDNTDEEYDQGPMITFEVTEPAPAAAAGFPWWVIIVLALVLTVGVGGLTWWMNSRDKPVEVPPLKDLMPAQAILDLEAAGLRAGAQTPEHDGEITAGRVIRGEPESGVRVSAGSQVDLIVSSGPQLIRIPDVENQRIAAARQAIREAGLEVGMAFAQGRTCLGPFWDVERTHPATGTPVPIGSEVDLYLKCGRPGGITPIPLRDPIIINPANPQR
ncbi:PASTA domain-containing protein [Ectothiorhodospira lacustris]|uniref:PASTA domain-containing protein n=1 Tax=Ectothiorhodospira lacustris TaxID=2899127 RepID=UPI001EE946EF|nr:PASTA domain-containing protein [Ectothiorhodospira lacustris]MCG5501133.1 PASTA domain-containing protein [Ectothiorhodospira lacustris]MCG5511225.1 PASTA domain-containing protein [Ectothiorhodospira lacustris]MCG5522959.1 PASTA domain-containing protein [Ectothiorhodospira lacustris]